MISNLSQNIVLKSTVAQPPDVKSLRELSPRDEKFAIKKKKAGIVAEVYSTHHQTKKYSQRIRECAQNLEFAVVKDEETNKEKYKLKSARFCRVRFCPICQWRRMLYWRAKAFNALPLIEEEFPNHRWVFLTLTVENCPLTELRPTLGKMNKAWGKLVKRKKYPAEGYIRTTEITRNYKDGTAHPHFHILMLVKKSYFKDETYLKHSEWTDLWQKSLKTDYQPIVHIQAIEPGEHRDAVLETFKYSVKEDDLINVIDDESLNKELKEKGQLTGAEWLLELTIQTRGLRFMTPGGVCKPYFSKTKRAAADDEAQQEEPLEEETTEESEENLIHVNDKDEIKERKVIRTVTFSWHPRFRDYISFDLDSWESKLGLLDNGKKDEDKNFVFVGRSRDTS